MAAETMAPESIPSGEKHANRHVGHQMCRHALAHGDAGSLPQRRGGLWLRARRVRGATVGEHAALVTSLTIPTPPGTRRQRLDIAQPRERRGHTTPGQERQDASRRRPPIDQTSRGQCRQFRCKGDLLASRGNIQWLDPKPIARQKERVIPLAPACQREHPPDSRERLRPIANNEPKQNLGIACSREAVAARFEVAT